MRLPGALPRFRLSDRVEPSVCPAIAHRAETPQDHRGGGCPVAGTPDWKQPQRQLVKIRKHLRQHVKIRKHLLQRASDGPLPTCSAEEGSSEGPAAHHAHLSTDRTTSERKEA